MRILGIHNGHNASACLLENGSIRFCIQEERLTNSKNYFGFPFRSIETILTLANLGTDDIDSVAMASSYMPVMSNPFDVVDAYRKQASFVGRLNSVARGNIYGILVKTRLNSIYNKRARRKRLEALESSGLERCRTIFVDHHLCHAATAYYGSPWRDEPVLVLTNDGSGDGLCSTVYIGKDGELTKVAETPKGHSLGNIYARTTFLLGLSPWEHEWKVMGLAPYAPASGIDKSYEVFRRLIKIAGNNPLAFEKSISESTELIYPRLRRELELHRFDWIAGGVQKYTEELLCQWVRNCVNATGIRRVALAGGVFMNVKANKRIMELDDVEDLFIFPSCGDESISIGAAYQVYVEECREQGKPSNIQPLREIYLGPSFTDQDVEQAISKIEHQNFESRYVKDIESRIAELLARGEIVARCKGRMEFGARALGNRSILADAADYSCVRVINMMVKKRDFWMPFAPVIMKERQNDYIVDPKGISAPYMMLSFDTTRRRNEFNAAVHQADLTARPQILEREMNPEFYSILEEFERITGKGILLNTSFNLHGYPIVYGPREALWVFLNSDLNHLALGNYLLQK